MLAVELAPANIGMTIVMPGAMATAIIKSGEEGSAAMTLGMNPAYVGRRVVKAIENGELHVFTHGDYRPLVATRCEALLAAFGESAQPGFKESEEVLRIMSNTAYPPGSVSRKLRA